MKRRSVDRFESFREFPELRTRRLILREVSIGEAPWYLEHFSRPEIVHGQGSPPPDGLKGAREELQRYFVDLFRNRDGFRWGISLRSSGKLIGSVGYYKWVKPSGHQAEMGYDLDREYWGMGLMAEAMTTIIDFGFSKMGLNRIEVLIMPRNARSQRLIRKLGFRREAVLRQHSLDEKDDFCDDVLYSLLRADWMDCERSPQRKSMDSTMRCAVKVCAPGTSAANLSKRK